MQPLLTLVFETELGWMGFRIATAGVHQLTFDHRSSRAVEIALQQTERLTTKRTNGDKRGSTNGADVHPHVALTDAQLSRWCRDLQSRLTAYASGTRDDFLDVPIDLTQQTPFQRQVYQACRQIAVGETESYAQLAARVGSPLAARAIGNAMSRNRLPLIIPCHRVVGGQGALGGFSSPSGLEMKRRLLAMEAASRVTAVRPPSSPHRNHPATESSTP